MSLPKTLGNTERLKTAGEIQNYLRSKEGENYSHFDLGYTFSSSKIQEGIEECVNRHWDTFHESITQFCVVCFLAFGEGNLTDVVRVKFMGVPFLPSPAPLQSVWLIDKKLEGGKLLWCLPHAERMAQISEEFSFDPHALRMKTWCDWWYMGAKVFWENIRKMHGIKMLSHSEHNDRHRELGGKYINDEFLGVPSDSSYLPEIRIKKLETVRNTSFVQGLHDLDREAN